MENNQMNNPGKHERQDKDTNLQDTNSNIEIKPPGIGVLDLKNEIDLTIKQSNKAKEVKENHFPVEVFPLHIQKIIKATNENLNFPIDFIGGSILYTGSIAIGNALRAEVMEGFKESAVLYIAIVARTGTNKTHPLKFALGPIFEHDKKTYSIYKTEKQEYDRLISLSKKERLLEGIYEITKPYWKRILLSDYTPEALAAAHNDNKRGLGVFSDEIVGWFKNFNRYNKGGEMEFWLSAWNSIPLTIDRRTTEPIRIQIPFISVIGTTQKRLLNELAKDNRTQNGFMDRILFIIPNNILKSAWNQEGIDPEISANWQKIIFNLLNLEVNYDDAQDPLPKILKFSNLAKQLLFKWQKENTKLVNETENEAISSIYSKMDMYVVRLALILEAMRFACNESNLNEINDEALKGAIKLIEYFKRSAVTVNSIISNADPLDKQPGDKRKLYEALPEFFTTVQGVKLAEEFGIPQRTFKRFLNDRELFNRERRGEYEKRF